MAQQTLATLGAALVANAAGVATAMQSPITTANVTALGNLILNLSKRRDLSIPAMVLTPSTDIAP